MIATFKLRRPMNIKFGSIELTDVTSLTLKIVAVQDHKNFVRLVHNQFNVTHAITLLREDIEEIVVKEGSDIILEGV